MKARDINFILDHMRDNVKVLTPDTLNNAKFAVIINSAPFMNAFQISEIDKTKEQKQKALDAIKDVIEDIKRNGIPRRINNYLFAIGYPESYDLLLEYYDVLGKACMNSTRFVGYDKEHGFGPFYNKESEILKKVNILKETSLLMFMPILGYKKIDEIKNDVGISLEDYKKMVDTYKKLKIFGNELQMEINMANVFYTKIRLGVTLEKLCEEYKLTQEYVRNILGKHLSEQQYEEVQKILKGNSMRRYMHIQQVVELLFQYVPDGIEVGDKKVPFGMLDYYTITQMNPETILDYIMKPDNFKKVDHDMMVRRAKVKKFLAGNKNPGKIINRKQADELSSRMTTANGEFDIQDYVDEIFQYLGDNGVYTYKKLVEDAFTRIARGQPMLPLTLESFTKENEKKLV